MATGIRLTQCAVVLAAACAPAKLSPYDRSLASVHKVFVSVARYQDSLGHLPIQLAEVCRANMWWCGQDSSRWLLDGWSRPVAYQGSSAGYQVRSLGRDGRLDTEDDLILSSSGERALVQQLAGCYELPAEVWPGMGRQLSLDTVAVRPREYRLRPAWRSESAVWYPLPGGFLWALWPRVPAGYALRLRVAGDSLVGAGIEFSDFAGTRHREVFARRVGCSSRGEP